MQNGNLLETSKKSYSIIGLDTPLGLQEVQAPRIAKQLAHEGGKLVSHTHWLPLPLRRYPWYSFLLEAELTPGPQCSWKDQISEKFQ
jgi:hypothetical protein